MSGLSVLYASEAAKERDWEAIPDRDRPGRLREVYWANRAGSDSGRNQFLEMNLTLRPDRSMIGRGRNDPGDGFIYRINTLPRVEDRFEWLEVTEVFTAVPASQIERAMRTWNGIPDKDPVDFDEFRKGVRRERPSRVEQRQAADQVIAQIEKKLAKRSYGELLEKYGYGTLVVGMPLWFAVPPDNPFRTENAVDDFMTRTALGLEEIKQDVLRRRHCPFGKVIVVWDTTPQALRAWRKVRSAEYENPANASVKNPLPVKLVDVLSDSLEEALLERATPESEAPLVPLYVDVKTQKRAAGKGPFPKFVEAMAEVSRKSAEASMSLGEMIRLRLAAMLCGLLCFLRIYGADGLERWIARKFSVSHAWRARAERRRARRFYRESRLGGRTFGRARNRSGVGAQRRWPNRRSPA